MGAAANTLESQQSNRLTEGVDTHFEAQLSSFDGSYIAPRSRAHHRDVSIHWDRAFNNFINTTSAREETIQYNFNITFNTTNVSALPL